MTTTRRILVWAGPLLALVVLGAVVLHWWLDVADAREAYEAKLEALRAAGEPVTWEDFTRPLPPEEENAAPILTEVYEAYERAFPDYPGPLDHLMYLNLEEELSPEQKADLEAWAPTVDALVERLREAARLPRLAFGGSAAFYEDDESAGIAIRAEHLLSSWAQYRKETATTAAEALLALTAAYEPRGFLDLIRRHLMLYGALDIFARDISAGRDVPAAARQRMVASLRRIEETVLPDRRLFVREHRAWIVAAVDWEVSGDPPENLAVADEQITPYGGLHLRAALYREAHAILEEVDAELEATSSIRHLFPPLATRAGGQAQTAPGTPHPRQAADALRARRRRGPARPLGPRSGREALRRRAATCGSTRIRRGLPGRTAPGSLHGQTVPDAPDEGGSHMDRDRPAGGAAGRP